MEELVKEPKRLLRVKGKYKNKDAVENVIRYITRTRVNESQEKASELVSYGGRGVSADSPENVIMEMEKVQEAYNKKSGRRVYHEFYLLNDSDFESMGMDYETVQKFAHACAGYYYNRGYQVEYAVHKSHTYHIHIHFVYNSVSSVDGRKVKDYKGTLDAREKLFDEIAREFHADCPIFCSSLEYI